MKNVGSKALVMSRKFLDWFEKEIELLDPSQYDSPEELLMEALEVFLAGEESSDDTQSSLN